MRVQRVTAQDCLDSQAEFINKMNDFANKGPIHRIALLIALQSFSKKMWNFQ